MSETAIWKPLDGEAIQGVLKERGNTITQYGDAKYIVLEKEKEGRIKIYTNQLLEDLLDYESAEIGDTIAIKYRGLVQGKKRKYKDYLLAKA